MVWLQHLHREGGETGHLGEFIFGLGAFILAFYGILLAIAGVLLWPLWSAGEAVRSDAVIVGALFGVLGLGTAVFGAFAIFSGWGRHHPRYESGDPDVADIYDAEGT